MASMYFLSDSISITLTVVFALILSLPLIVWCLFKKSNEKRRTKKYHPVAGTIFHQLYHFKKLHDYVTDLAGKYRTYRLLAPSRSEIFTADPVNVEHILKTNFHKYGKGEHNLTVLKDFLGYGILAVDGEKWSQQRKISSYEFSTKALRDYSIGVFGHNAAKLASIISEAAKSNQSIDIQDLFMKSSLDSILRVVFGDGIDSLCGSNEGGERIIRAIDDASEMSLRRYADVFWKIKKFLNIGSEATLKKSVEMIDELVYKIIDSRTKKMNDQGKKGDVLSRLLQEPDNDLKSMRDLTLNLIAAGKDATAVSMSWFICMMCKHPEVQERVAKEVRAATTQMNEFSAKVDDGAIDKMNYLRAAITESLRLYPAVPLDAKICFADDTLPDGFSVRKGDMVTYLPYAMGRMKFIWGDDAEKYRPERWLDEDGIFQPESPFKFTAFQAGTRSCIGREFAYRQMKIIAAVLLGCFVFRLDDDTSVVNYKTMITLNIEGGLWIRAALRSC